jgi:glycosyltransferase involved in cell wall biosynthesis
VSVAVIIPAHDEEIALRRCLVALALQTYPGPFEIVVVPNGCADRTAGVARELIPLFPPEVTVRVVELEAAGKWKALNAGDAATEADFRIYLDADIVLSPNAVDDLLTVLAAPGPLLAQPEFEIEPERKPYAVRAFIRVWSGLPYVREQVLGLGCYAVNRAGRERWAAFPPLGADDTYVRMRFEEADKRVVSGAKMMLSFPSSLGELIRVRARWCRLSRIVREGETEMPPSEQRRWPAALRFIGARPRLWADAVVFAAIWACAVALSRRPQSGEEWARASSSRVRDPEAAEWGHTITGVAGFEAPPRERRREGV